MANQPDKKEQVRIIASRVAQELKDGYVINLGIGIPTQVVNYMPKGISVTVTSENGILGVGGDPAPGTEDKDLINAGGGFISAIPCSSYVSSCDSFGLIRGGHLDMTVLGALQVAQNGDIANWIIPGKLVPGMGGAMDLCNGAKRVIVSMVHTEKTGAPKILKECTLPLTAQKCVSKIITDMAVIERTEKGMVLKEVAYWTSVDDVIKATEADLIIDENIKVFGQ